MNIGHFGRNFFIGFLTVCDDVKNVSLLCKGRVGDGRAPRPHSLRQVTEETHGGKCDRTRAVIPRGLSGTYRKSPAASGRRKRRPELLLGALCSVPNRATTLRLLPGSPRQPP